MPSRRVIAACAGAAGVAAVLRRRRRPPAPALRVVRPTDDATELDPATGAVRSVQSVEVELPLRTIDELWSAHYLERLARTYWRYLARATLGLVRVRYGEHERALCLLHRRLALLVLSSPSYHIDHDRAAVRWRIERGLLVARRGRDTAGYLEIEVRRAAGSVPDLAHVAVDVRLEGFLPAIAATVGQWLYAHTQSRVHVLVTRGFLRSLADLRLERSVVGRYADAAAQP